MKLTETKLKELIRETLGESRKKSFKVTLPPSSRNPKAPPETKEFTVPQGYFVGKISQWPDGMTIRVNKGDKQRSINLNLDKFGEYGPDMDGVHLSTSIRGDNYWYGNVGQKSGSRMLSQQAEHDEKYLYDKFSNEQIFEAIQSFLEKIKNL